MRDSEIYNKRLSLLFLFIEGERWLASCEELIQDSATTKQRSDFMSIATRLYALKESIRSSIPCKCDCGSFEFEEKKICVLEGGHCRRVSREWPLPQIKASYKYVCLKCGTEVKSEGERRQVEDDFPIPEYIKAGLTK